MCISVFVMYLQVCAYECLFGCLSTRYMCEFVSLCEKNWNLFLTSYLRGIMPLIKVLIKADREYSP